jgi:3-dehydroquinate synthase class II
MLSARDETIRTYLTALRMKLRETTGLSDAEKDATYSQIDAQIAWYNDHKDKLPSAQTLEDLVSDSNSAKDHFTATTAIIYSTLVQIDSGKIRGLRGEQVKVIDSLNQKIGQISQNGDKNVIPLERAISDIQNKVDRSVAKESEAQVAILKVQQKGASAAAMAAAYEDAIARLNDAFLYLKDINLNLQDVVRQIKTQD